MIAFFGYVACNALDRDHVSLQNILAHNVLTGELNIEQCSTRYSSCGFLLSSIVFFNHRDACPGDTTRICPYCALKLAKVYFLLSQLGDLRRFSTPINKFVRTLNAT